MLASMRHLLRIVDLDSVFDNYGFTKKVITVTQVANGVMRFVEFVPDINNVFRLAQLSS